MVVIYGRSVAIEMDNTMHGSVSQGVSLHLYSETLVLHLKFVTAVMHFPVTQVMECSLEVITLLDPSEGIMACERSMSCVGG